MGGDENDEKRARVKQEILMTERSYVSDLATVIDIFMKPLMKNAKEGGIQAVISREEVTALFSNIESILNFNQQLLLSLEEESATGQSNIGQIFIEMAPYLRMYCIYVNGHSRATELHQSLMERRISKEGISPYAQFLAECSDNNQERVRNRQMTDMLIMPVQRVPRYRLLLEELLKRTPPGDEYDSLEMGLAKIADVANLVNERLRDHENRMMVLKMQKRFGNAVRFVEPHRRFVMEGTLQKMCRKGPKDYVFVLFSDLLVYGVPTTTLASIAGGDEVVEQPVAFKRQIDLASCSLSSTSDTSFQVSSPTKSFLVIAPDQSTAKTWYGAVEQCMLHCIQRAAETSETASVAASSTSGDSSHAPLWVPDKDAPNCQMPECGVKFTLLTRRHHCRSCGLVVCAECSSHRWHLPNIDKAKPQRICNQCYMEIRNKLEEDNFESAGSLNAPRPAPPPSSKIPASSPSSSGGGGSFLPQMAVNLFSRLSWSGPIGTAATSSGTNSNLSKPSSPPLKNVSVQAPSVASSAKNGPPADNNKPRKAESTASSSSSEDLPKNWRALKDEHGRTYYWHVITDMVTYERPTGKVKATETTSSTSKPPMNTSLSSTKLTTSSSTASPLRPSSSGTANNIKPSSSMQLNKRPLPVETKQPASATSPPLPYARLSDSNGLLPPSSPLNGKSTSPDVAAKKQSSMVPVNAAANMQPYRRTSAVQGPSLAERLAALSDQGVFGDPKLSRFSVKKSQNNSHAHPTEKSKPSSVLRNQVSSTGALTVSGGNVSSSPLVSPKSIPSQNTLPKVSLPSSLSASNRSQASAKASSPQSQSSSLSTPSSAKPLERSGSSSSPVVNRYTPQLSSSKPVELSQLNDAEFFRVMGVFRSEYEKLSTIKKSDLKRAKNAI